MFSCLRPLGLHRLLTLAPWCRAEMELVLAQEYTEHDTYTLFACLMKDMKPFFVSDAYQRPEEGKGRSQQKVGQLLLRTRV